MYTKFYTQSVELEGYYLRKLGSAETGDLINPTNQLPEHDFIDKLPTQGGVFLANALLRFRIPSLCRFQPYIGGGIGAAKLWITGADSLQVAPPEAGVNHFNSDRDSSDWTFAAQGKAGLRFQLCGGWRLFAEYRFLYLCPTNYTFGETVAPNHVATTDWRVRVNGQYFNLGVVGLEYSL